MDLESQRRLVEAVLRVQDMGRRANRDLYVGALEGALGHRLVLSRFDQAKHDVWEIVQACLDHVGAVHTLVEVLESFHGRSRPVLELRVVVAEILPEPLLKAAERRELRELVAALESGGLSRVLLAALPELYRHAVGAAGPQLGPDVRTLNDVVAWLEEAPVGIDGLPPLLVFVADVAGRAEGAAGAALWDWARRLAGRLGIDSSLLERLQLEGGRVSSGTGDGATYLIVECRSDAAEAERFLLTAWLQVGAKPGITLVRGDGPWGLDELGEPLRVLLTEHPTVVSRVDPELIVEFVVPRELLDFPFDQIKIDFDGVVRRLGVEHPVVLRSLDRLARPALHHRWRRKWEFVRDDREGVRVHWVEEGGAYDQERLYTRLSEPPWGVLATPFPCGRERTPVDELWVALQAGIPIITWCRRGDDAERFRDEAGVLMKGDLLALPRRVYELRRAAVMSGAAVSEDGGADLADRNAGEHPGFRLGVLFDDADRVPEPYMRLKAPV